MTPLKTVSGSVAAISFFILSSAGASALGQTQPALEPTTPNDAAATAATENLPTLTAQAGMPDSSGTEVDDACRAAANASNGGHPGTIVSCFHGGDTGNQRVEASKAVDQSTNTGALHPPDVSGLPGCLGPCITLHFGHVPPPVYYIDLDSIPEPPKGSDAWKISQGVQRAP